MSKLTTTYLPPEVYLPTQVKENEARAAQTAGIKLYDLMEQAGAATFYLLKNIFPHGAKLAVVTGPGNNAGDGYVVARLAVQAGWQVTLAQMPDCQNLQSDAAMAAEKWQVLTTTAEFGHAKTKTAESVDFSEFDIILDAVLGTGANKHIKDAWQPIFKKINQSPVLTVSVDVPSGLNAQTGVALMPAQANADEFVIRADHTVTFIAVKSGLVTADAADYVGRIHYADLGIGDIFVEQNTVYYKRTELNLLRHHLAARSRIAHKHDFGHVVCIGGDRGMSGAIRLAAQACLQAGAGLVTVLTHPDNVIQVSASCPELMVQGVNGLTDDLIQLLAKADVVLAGPGMGQSGWANGLMQQLTQVDESSTFDKPMVVDADGLNWLASNPVKRANWILTPHLGEASRLLAENKATIHQDRYASATELCLRYGGVSVLKGAGSLIASSQKTSVCVAGNPGMASAGMGDVLSGLCAAMLAQGLDLYSAAQVAVCLHAEAGDIAAAKGERGLIASDLLAHIRELINEH
ncbi:NAD(P)H-hydrate dehydratase [Catenovulum sp. SM1970]|uniref:NAD(P)H-hydrate dehydratase n=1 Tax=Marinifaba aquimaris TaxID=2741323 RepID=UPI0015720C4F|nr:NAD(P)H-hydrate dehydratase [Marinifaba aquimaris]NTS77468.1 NAD(P)H-hydrate dehydratase [Marinifaba aquimaris]